MKLLLAMIVGGQGTVIVGGQGNVLYMKVESYPSLDNLAWIKFCRCYDFKSEPSMLPGHQLLHVLEYSTIAHMHMIGRFKFRVGVAILLLCSMRIVRLFLTIRVKKRMGDEKCHAL
jgi:hypothetical protein